MAFSVSVEHRTLKDNMEELKQAIKPQLKSLGAKLVSTRLLSDVMYRIIRTPGVSDSDGAAAVLEIMDYKVQLNPQCYHTFVAVLLGNEVRYEHILQKLQDTYQSYEQQRRYPQNADTATKESAAVTSLQQRLTIDDVTTVVDCINDLSRGTLMQLGAALGLTFIKRTNPKDLAQSWLQKEDGVLLTSGEPTWSSLVTALQRIGHADAASRIIKKFERADESLQQRMETESAIIITPRLEMKDIFKELYSVRSRWFEIGLSLRLNLSTLESIKHNHSDVADCLREMLVVWLKGNGIPVTWISLIEVLESPVIGEGVLAEHLRRKYISSGVCEPVSEKSLMPMPFRPFIMPETEDDSLSLLGTRISSLGGERYEDYQLSELFHRLYEHSSHWLEIGVHLGFGMGELDNIECKERRSVSCLREMLSQWLQWTPGDSRGSRGFATREALRDALVRASLGSVAQELPPGDRRSEPWSEARMKAAKPKSRYN